jgi:endonuclease G
LLKITAVRPEEYTHTGYDRGHLVPARDMNLFPVAREESFFMSNISPQLPRFNRGIWKKLESEVWKIALREKDLLIVTGPIWNNEKNETLTNTDIPTPVAFFKVIFDLTPPEKMIAFIIPHNASSKQLESFVMSVKHAEELTGLNFFPELPEERQKELESTLNINEWRLSNSRKIKL